jgi:hypothetical protein
MCLTFLFSALVHEVENRLRILPQEFNNQSLANVVWGAGKLRLSVSLTYRAKIIFFCLL